MSQSAKPRLKPVPKASWDEEAREALRTGFPGAADRFLSSEGDDIPVPNVLGTLLNHPALAGPFLTYNRVLLEAPALGHRLRELIVLRVAWRTQAEYEWAQHARLASELGFTRDQIESIGRSVNDREWSPLEADLLVAADQLVDDQCIDDETWARLAEQLDARQLVEVVFVVGTYTCLAMAFNSFGLQLDPGLESGPPLPPPE